MRYNLRTRQENSTVIATFEVTDFVASEATQCTLFGPITLNFGGNFAATAPSTLNFQLEPQIQVINPTQISFSLERVFKLAGDISDPVAAAELWLNTNLTRFTSAVTDWKAKTFTPLSLSGTL